MRNYFPKTGNRKASEFGRRSVEPALIRNQGGNSGEHDGAPMRDSGKSFGTGLRLTGNSRATYTRSGQRVAPSDRRGPQPTQAPTALADTAQTHSAFKPDHEKQFPRKGDGRRPRCR